MKKLYNNSIINLCILNHEQKWKWLNNTEQESLILNQMQELKKLLNEIKISQDNINGKEISNRKVEFSKKEIKEMPRLKDFKIRVKQGKYYEIRFRKYGYNVSFSSTNFEVAKRKAFTWLNTFESQIKPEVHFTVLSRADIENFNISKKVTFKEFADNYVYNVKKKMVKEVSFRNYKNYYEKILLPKFGKMQLGKINPIMLQMFLDHYNSKTPRLCEDIKCLLNGIFDYALNNGVIERNPLKMVYIPKHERKTGMALTPTEEKALLNNIKGSKYEVAYLKMLYSGVRPCEINGIEESIENNTLTIKNGKLKSYQKNLTRTVPIFPKYKDTLNRVLEKNLSTYKMELEFKELCPHHTIKDLRHTFTTRARECGVDNELVSVWTGHSLGNITSSVYTHFSMEYQQKEALKVNY